MTRDNLCLKGNSWFATLIRPALLHPLPPAREAQARRRLSTKNKNCPLPQTQDLQDVWGEIHIFPQQKPTHSIIVSLLKLAQYSEQNSFNMPNELGGEIHSCSDPGSCAVRYLGRRSDSPSNQFNVQDSERILDWNVVSAPYYSRRILSLGWIDIFDVSIALQLDQGRGTGQCITVPIIIKIEPVRRPEGYHYPMRNPARPKFSLLP